jgi:hypothetical protein
MSKDNGREDSRRAEIRAGLHGYTGHLSKGELSALMTIYSAIMTGYAMADNYLRRTI